jgi:methylated-DNA-[protein]-cysteine S-methyltransferase
VISLTFDEVESPLGTLLVVSGKHGLALVEFDCDVVRASASLKGRLGPVELRAAADPGGGSSRLRDYFAGDLTAIDSLAVQAGGTPFQVRVWSELRRIPAGSTRSYSEIARALGQPLATRAVGLANGSNPLAVVVPCHRVIGADGSLTGYGGGLERKRWLLSH